MKKLIFIGLFIAFGTLASFTAHKFYVSIYQINYAPEKKMLQITSRIFIDDLNEALLKNYKRKTFLGETNESADDVALLKKYLLDHFSIKANGQSKTINYLSHEFENNVIICYFNVKEATKIKTIEIRNNALFELFDDQQNIIQANIHGRKQNLLLTADNASGVLKWE